MPLHSCITLDATTTFDRAKELIRDSPDGLYVVVRRHHRTEILWYALTVFGLRASIDDACSRGLPPDASLAQILDLHETDAVPAFQSGEPGDLSSRFGVLVRGSDPIGVLKPEVRTRGIPVSAPSGSGSGLRGAPGVPGEPQVRGPFSAYPSLTAPETIGRQQEFALVIGLSATPVAGVAGARITADVPAEFRFHVQVVADEFSFPAGSAAVLDVVRDRFDEAEVSVRMVAPAVAAETGLQCAIEVLFFYQGGLCGRALRMIGVDATPSTTEPIRDIGTASVSIPDMPAPDLTITASRGSRDDRLMWTIVARDAPDPIGPIPHDFRRHTAKTFALDRVRALAQWDKSSLTPAHLTGIGEEISQAMPNEFWTTLNRVWAVKQRSGDPPPSILIVSEDPYIPWELAALTPRYAPPERLDPRNPPFLATQLRVGRWIPPVRTPFGGDVPVLPPPSRADVGDMVLFVGDYSALRGHRELPLALEEGKQLARAYGAIARQAVIDDVTDLLNDTIVEDGSKITIDAVHFACHGEVSSNPLYNGIVLSDREVRLGADMIAGSSIGRSSSPLVFLNACQLGTETEGLDGNYGGLAGAFLDQRATAFIAPLWTVDDDIAKEFALDFYEQIFGSDRSVADVLRELRSRFEMSSSSPRASYLAYVYYGHPDLVIDRVTGDSHDEA